MGIIGLGLVVSIFMSIRGLGFVVSISISKEDAAWHAMLFKPDAVSRTRKALNMVLTTRTLSLNPKALKP